MNPIGTVSADNVEDSESLDSIRYGLIKGTGLLGKVLAEVNKLIELEKDVTYHMGDYVTKELCDALHEQRVKFYESLKAIERTQNENRTL